MAGDGVVIGYARCSTDAQDPTAQRQRLGELGVTDCSEALRLSTRGVGVRH